MLTRKHFEALAAEIRQIPDRVVREQAAHAMARVCRQFNPNFDMSRFLAACDVLEALWTEVETLRADLKESDEIREKHRDLLTRIAAALKGEPPEGVWHSWHDLPEKATQLVDRVQRDEALLREALYALEYASDMTKPEGLQGCGCPICTNIAALRERLGDEK